MVWIFFWTFVFFLYILFIYFYFLRATKLLNINLVTTALENGLKWHKKGWQKAAFILKLEVGPHSRPYLLSVLNMQ